MSEAFIDLGSLPYPGFVNAAPTFNPIFLIEPPGPVGIGIYVSPDGGSDSNPGTISEPFQTLSRALTARGGLSNALYVAIFLLPGNYTQAGQYVIPNNTALIGAQAGGTTDYLNASQQTLGGSPVTLTNYSLALGSALPATGGRVLLSGLNVLGAVSPQDNAPTYFMYNCNVQNNTNLGIVPGAALYSVAGTRVYIEGCTFTSSTTANSVMLIQSEEFSLVNSTVKMTNVTPGGGTCAPVIGQDRAATISPLNVQYLTIRDCEISTANGNIATTTIAPLLRFNLSSPSASRTIADITYTSMRYDQGTTVNNPPDKTCINVSNGRTVDVTLVNCILLQPGGSGDSIRSSGVNTSIVFGNNLGINGRNGRAGFTFNTQLQAMP